MTARIAWGGGHLGTRVSALLDGQLSPADEERAWAHVHACHACRDEVEHEGWVKTRLAQLSFGSTDVPAHLRGSLLDASAGPASLTPGESYLTSATHERARRVGLVALGSGAAGAAVMGLLAFGGTPADLPNFERRAPATNITNAPTPVVVGHNRREPTP
ncbi:anti-sigma factor [Nocardioides sp.]|uniref:anti-sigma factor family protein n=1 Tax=Nocardioides sp. TaxID=35761 RepID=UPI00356A1A07